MRRSIVGSSLLLSKLQDGTLDGLQSLDHIGVGLAFVRVRFRNLAVLRTGPVPTFEALGSQFFLSVGRQSTVLCFCVIMILHSFRCSSSTSLKLGDPHGRGRLRLQSLFDEILVQCNTGIKVVAKRGVQYDARLDRIELVSLDPVK